MLRLENLIALDLGMCKTSGENLNSQFSCSKSILSLREDAEDVNWKKNSIIMISEFGLTPSFHSGAEDVHFFVLCNSALYAAHPKQAC